MNSIRQTVHTGAIDSGGGHVNVAPVVNNPLSEPQEEWRQALLRGPVAALGLEDRLDRAHKKVSSDRPAEAAVDLNEIADRIGDAGYPVVADDLRLEAAGLLQEKEPAEAHYHMLSVAQRQIDRADLDVDPLLWHLGERVQTLPSQLTRLLSQINDAVLPSREEVEAACAILESREDRSWWRARLTELAFLEEEFELALQVAEPLRSSSPQSLNDLLLEMDALAAQEALKSAISTEEGWRQLLAWAEEAPRSPQERGLVLQRRGTVLAYRDDLEGSRRAYLSAARAWADAPDEQEEAATALFSSGGSFLGTLPSEERISPSRPTCVGVPSLQQPLPIA